MGKFSDKYDLNKAKLLKQLIEKSYKKQYTDAQLSILLKTAGDYNIYIKNPYSVNDEYIINGQKVFCTNAGKAGTIIITAANSTN